MAKRKTKTKKASVRKPTRKTKTKSSPSHAAKSKPSKKRKEALIAAAKKTRPSKASKPSKTAKAPKTAKRKGVSPLSLPFEEEPLLVPVPLPEGVRPQRLEPNERSAHLEKLKQLFEAAPISRALGMSLGYCENGVARVRLPFRKDFEEGHGVIHGGLIGLLGDTAGNFAVGSVSPGATVKTVEFKISLLTGVTGDLLAIGEVVRKGRTLAMCRIEVVEGNDRVVAIGLATYALQAV
ncbi:MAG TPA: PaaI family thioesterase [Vicinamibacteria bacterium]|nr:PaaI family thioesterase [Vicinamibacteria bacterium]